MGDPAGDRDEKPRRVTISRPFYLGKYEVTQAQFEAVMGKNPSHFSPRGDGAAAVQGQQTGRFPVDNVSWQAAELFCTELGTKVGRKVALPSEAQWEYACRAGTDTAFHIGTALNGTQANCDGTSPFGTDRKGPSLGRTCEVGSYPANAWGLHDMHGNVWEWCADWYGPPDGLGETDPERTEKGGAQTRVLRGGSWDRFARDCRSAYRYGYAPAFTYNGVGFRVAVRLD
jgi:formylglycine-generating enzyme required for sulfatase activity